MSTILFFTSDRLAFANVSPTATTEKVLLIPDPVTGNRLFIGNSTMIGYDGRCNISTFDGSKATVTIDTMNNRFGIGISSPTSALHVIDPTGVTVVGPVNFTGATTLTGPTNVIGTMTASYFTGSAINLTSIPAARLVGNLPASVYANGTIPIAALSGYNSGNLGLSGTLTADSIGVANSLSVNVISTGIITGQTGDFNNLSTANAVIDTLNVKVLSTTFGYMSTLTVGTLFATNISTGGFGTNGAGFYSSISAGMAFLNTLNVNSISAGTGAISSFIIGTLFAGSISSGTLSGLSSAIVNNTNLILSISTGQNTFIANLSTLSNLITGISTNVTATSTNVNTLSNLITGISTNVTATSTVVNTISNIVATNTTNIGSISNSVNFLLTVNNLSDITISTNYAYISTLSAGAVFSRFIGDGSLLTNVPFNISSALSTIILSTSFLYASSLSTFSMKANVGYISTLITTNYNTNSFSTAVGYASTFTIGTLFATSISSGSIGSLLTAAGAFSSISAGTATIEIANITNLSAGTGTFSSLTVGSLFAASISSGSIGSLTTAGGAFSSISAGTGTIGIANIISLSTGSIVASSLTIGNTFTSTINALAGNFSSISIGTAYVGFETISSLSAGTINAGNVTANNLSSYIVYTSSLHTPNIYVTNIYANDGGIANVVASSLNASKAVFIQVIASSFQGTLLGRNVLQVQGL